MIVTKPTASEIDRECRRVDASVRVEQACAAGRRAFYEWLASVAIGSGGRITLATTRPDGDVGMVEHCNLRLWPNGDTLDISGALNEALVEAVSMADGPAASAVRQTKRRGFWARLRWLMTR